MKKNLGSPDRIIRLLLALVVAGLYYTDQITGTAALVFGLFGVIFLATSAIGFCPLYVPFKLSTKKSIEKA